MSRAWPWAILALFGFGCATPRTNSTVELGNGVRLAYVASPGDMDPNPGRCVTLILIDELGVAIHDLTIIGYLEGRIPYASRESVQDTGIDQTLADRALHLGASWLIVLSEDSEGDVVTQRALLSTGNTRSHVGGGLKICR